MHELGSILREVPRFHTLGCLRHLDCDVGARTSSLPAVKPKPQPEDEGATTLGDLLYADSASSPINEQAWLTLVEAIAAGDQQALRTLYEMSHRFVFTLAVRICGRRELAEEVMLDVFHNVWQRAAQYDPLDGSVVGWLMIQTRSRAVDRVRYEQRKKRLAPHPEPEDLTAATGPTDALEATARRRSLEDALTTLTPDERAAIEMAFFAELTYSETATQLDEPLGTVKTRVRSALAKLRKALTKDRGPG